MTTDEEREVVMGELWVSHDELVDAIGDDGADLLCRAVGGVSTYIPRKPVAGSPISAVLGMKRMERLCAAFGGLRVTLPNRRKGEPFKDRIVRMLETGKSPGNIALELGVTERYVRILARQVKEQPKPQVQLRLW
ncbi:RNA helicase [Bilophila wadsworthia]|uniref:RNA helicase n=1 Tax=Bilophila wadsworthia TaxID=35833 RepID=UPI0032200360